VDVRVLVFVQVFVRMQVDVSMRVFHYPVSMRVFMVMAVLVRMNMPVLMVTVHFPSLTLLRRSPRITIRRGPLSEGRSSPMIAYSMPR
jgi:hypothetical protein